MLPFSPSTLLIEDTHSVDRGDLPPARLRANIAAYAAARNWHIAELLREERGALPITLAGDVDAYWAELAGQPCSGLRAGYFIRPQATRWRTRRGWPSASLHRTT